MSDKRWFVHLGDPSDPASDEREAPVVKDDEERLKRAMELLSELSLAGFLPEEFESEWDEIRSGYSAPSSG